MITQERLDDGVRLTVSMLKVEPIWYRWPGPATPCPGAVALLTCLPLAMKRAEKLRMIEPVPAGLPDNLERIQDVLTCFDLNLTRIEVEVEQQDTAPASKLSLACFTAGIDSLYTAWSLRPDLLLHAFGVEMKPLSPSLKSRVIERLQQAAGTLQAELVLVETNLRRVWEGQGIDFSMSFGLGLAALGYLFAARAGRFLVPSTFSYRHPRTWGSHPLLDPLCSSTRLEVVHHGSERVRPDKLEWLTHQPGALDHLRICPENVEARYNCGDCSKCRYAAITLALLGRLSDCPALPPESARPSNWRVKNLYEYRLAGYNLELARRVDAPAALVRRLTRARLVFRLHRWLREGLDLTRAAAGLLGRELTEPGSAGGCSPRGE